MELLTEKHREGIRHAEMFGKFPNCSHSILKSIPINDENVKIPLFKKKKNPLLISDFTFSGTHTFVHILTNKSFI